MYRLIYISTSNKDFKSDLEIKDLLSKSQESNRKNDITGILLHKDGEFIQVLEGKKQMITDLYEKIEKDKRHTNLIVIDKSEITEKYFSGYFMAFDPTHYSNKNDFEALKDFNNETFQSSEQDAAIKFLNHFLEIHKKYMEVNS